MEPHDVKGRIGLQDGERADFPRLGTRFIVRSKDTGERFALIEHTVPPRALAAPTHVHQNEDEYSFVLTGEVGVQQEARLLELISPGAFERYFAEMAPLLNVDGEPDRERIGEIQAKYGLSMDIDSIGPLTREHGLQA